MKGSAGKFVAGKNKKEENKNRCSEMKRERKRQRKKTKKMANILRKIITFESFGKTFDCSFMQQAKRETEMPVEAGRRTGGKVESGGTVWHVA